jgi:hypothetical protein
MILRWFGNAANNAGSPRAPDKSSLIVPRLTTAAGSSGLQFFRDIKQIKILKTSRVSA